MATESSIPDRDPQAAEETAFYPAPSRVETARNAPVTGRVQLTSSLGEASPPPSQVQPSLWTEDNIEFVADVLIRAKVTVRVPRSQAVKNYSEDALATVQNVARDHVRRSSVFELSDVTTTKLMMDVQL